MEIIELSAGLTCCTLAIRIVSRIIEVHPHGECGQVVKAPGCGPGDRGFESLHSPHLD